MCYLVKNGIPWNVVVGDEIPSPLSEVWSCALFVIFRELEGAKFNTTHMIWEGQGE